MIKLERVLVVDDNEITGYITEQTLRDMEMGPDIRLVKDGMEALKALRKGFKPGLILLDLNMPGMGGFDFLEEYQSLAETALEKPKIVIFTTSQRPEDRQRAMLYESVLGFADKPITELKLRKALELYVA